MILELNNLHNSGSKAQLTIESKNGEAETYYHENGSIVVTLNGASHLICTAFQFLLMKSRGSSIALGFNNYWKVGYIMNDEGKTINPLRPEFHDQHSPIGFDKVIDNEFMTRRWRNNPNLLFTLDDLTQTLRSLYNLDSSLLFSEYGEDCWNQSRDEWITKQIVEGCRRLVEGHIKVYGEHAVQSQLDSTNLKRAANQMKEITMEELKSGDYSFLDSEIPAV